jgi:hypothetical protein
LVWIFPKAIVQSQFGRRKLDVTGYR